MMDYVFYAFAVLVMPLGALWAAYVVTRINDRELERDRQLHPNNR